MKAERMCMLRAIASGAEREPINARMLTEVLDYMDHLHSKYAKRFEETAALRAENGLLRSTVTAFLGQQVEGYDAKIRAMEHILSGDPAPMADGRDEALRRALVEVDQLRALNRDLGRDLEARATADCDEIVRLREEVARLLPIEAELNRRHKIADGLPMMREPSEGAEFQRARADRLEREVDALRQQLADAYTTPAPPTRPPPVPAEALSPEVIADIRAALRDRRTLVEDAARVIRAIRLMDPVVRPGAYTIELCPPVHMGEVFRVGWRLAAELEIPEVTWPEPEGESR